MLSKAKVDIHWMAITKDTTIEEFVEMLPEDTFKDPSKVLIVASTDEFFCSGCNPKPCIKTRCSIHGSRRCMLTDWLPRLPSIIPALLKLVLSASCTIDMKSTPKGYKNTVTSEGTIYPSVLQTNALEAQIALMLLLYHKGNNRYTNMLDEVADRNLVLFAPCSKCRQKIWFGFHGYCDA